MGNLTCIERINLVVQIVANIFVVLGALFAIFQYRKQKKLTKIKNAIELAKYFANKIIDRASLVYSIFRDDKEIMEIIDRHIEEIQNAEYFNINEYMQIFNQEERDKYSEFLNTPIRISDNKFICLCDVLQDVINELEHCSINFNTGIADDKAVYQSMHQVILNLFPCAYPWIGSINESGVDLYYTNLCELYTRWNEIRKKSLRKEEKARKRLEKCKNNYSSCGKVKKPKV